MGVQVKKGRLIALDKRSRVIDTSSWLTLIYRGQLQELRRAIKEDSQRVISANLYRRKIRRHRKMACLQP